MDNGRRPKVSLVLDQDMDRWLEARAAAASATKSVIARQIIRAAMDGKTVEGQS